MQSDGCLRSGNQPPDVDEETALVANAAVLGVYGAFDDVLRVSVNDERRRGRMVATCEGVVGPRDWLCGYWDQCTDLVGDWLRELVLPAQGPS